MKTGDGETHREFESHTLRQKRTIFCLWTKDGPFQRNKSCRICEMYFVREILLRNVKYLLIVGGFFSFHYLRKQKISQ